MARRARVWAERRHATGMTRARAPGKRPRARGVDGRAGARDKPSVPAIPALGLALALTIAPAALAHPPRATPAPVASEPAVDDLCPGARAGLAALRERLPAVRVTSARRDRAREARAWADNIARKRRWMRILKGWRRPELAAAQAWIDAHWRELRGHPEPIAAHLEAVFAALSDADMATLSPHFDGRAVDLGKRRGLSRRLLSRLPNAVAALDEGDHFHVAFRCEAR